eukprot:m.109504 g.109504  ORF g.109504 m.109504 type:complete len:508 (-) comp13375_c0_seq14:1648-3171(-)
MSHAEPLRRLPQPFRRIDEVLSDIFEAAWREITARALLRERTFISVALSEIISSSWDREPLCFAVTKATICMVVDDRDRPAVISLKHDAVVSQLQKEAPSVVLSDKLVRLTNIGLNCRIAALEVGDSVVVLVTNVATRACVQLNRVIDSEAPFKVVNRLTLPCASGDGADIESFKHVDGFILMQSRTHCYLLSITQQIDALPLVISQLHVHRERTTHPATACLSQQYRYAALWVADRTSMTLVALNTGKSIAIRLSGSVQDVCILPVSISKHKTRQQDAQETQQARIQSPEQTTTPASGSALSASTTVLTPSKQPHPPHEHATRRTHKRKQQQQCHPFFVCCLSNGNVAIISAADRKRPPMVVAVAPCALQQCVATRSGEVVCSSRNGLFYTLSITLEHDGQLQVMTNAQLPLSIPVHDDQGALVGAKEIPIVATATKQVECELRCEQQTAVWLCPTHLAITKESTVTQLVELPYQQNFQGWQYQWFDKASLIMYSQDNLRLQLLRW